MKTRFLLIFVFILLGIFALIGGMRYFAFQSSQNELTLYGNVDIRQVNLGFRVSGRIEELYFDEGDSVGPGTLVATLEKQPYLDQARLAKAQVETARVNFDNAEQVYQRRADLIKSEGVSREDYENALANRNALEAGLKEATANFSVSMTNLRYTRLFAPTDAFILTRIREPGSAVNPTDPIFTLSVKSPVWIRAYVTGPQLGLIFPRMKATVTTDTPNGKSYEGFIGFISPVAEFTPKTVETTELRTDLVYRLRVIIDKPDEGLRQGMPVTVHLKLKRS